METKLDKLVVIVGATASGKTSLALDIAKEFNGEIVAADSWTVYKEFDIGTAKPSALDQLAIKHHLIDITTADKGFSAAIYKKLAKEAIDDIGSRGKLPILVGGSGLYIDSVIYDYGFLNKHDDKLRLELNDMTTDELLEITKSRGYDTENLDISNKRRIIRLIENNGERPTKKDLRTNTLIIGLNVDKDSLNTQINQRIEQMVNDGLEAEVNQLKKRYGWDIEPMKGIGYREWQDYFKGSKSKAETINNIQLATRHLVKKQQTWFKRNKSIHWVVNKMEAVDLVTTFLGK